MEQQQQPVSITERREALVNQRNQALTSFYLATETLQKAREQLQKIEAQLQALQGLADAPEGD